MANAVPQYSKQPEPPEELEFEILSSRCVFGEVGEVVKLRLTDGEILTMTETGALRRVEKRPSVADKERKAANG